MRIGFERALLGLTAGGVLATGSGCGDVSVDVDVDVNVNWDRSDSCPADPNGTVKGTRNGTTFKVEKDGKLGEGKLALSIKGNGPRKDTFKLADEISYRADTKFDTAHDEVVALIAWQSPTNITGPTQMSFSIETKDGKTQAMRVDVYRSEGGDLTPTGLSRQGITGWNKLDTCLTKPDEVYSEPSL